jgi:SRSO17 transposase
LQHLRRRALWDPEAVREALRGDVIQHLGDPEAWLVIDATGVLNKGRHAAGVARHYRGTAGRMEHCQIGVFLGDAGPRGQALLERALYLPKAWTDDPARCQQAGMPQDRRFATQPQLAPQRLHRALAAGVPATWVTGDRVYGDARRLRMWLETQPQASVLAVSGQEYVWLGWQPRQVKTILAALPEDGWTRLSAGDGSQGPRWYDWRWRPLADPMDPSWRRWLLVRRSISEPAERRASVVFAPQTMTLEAVVRVAGARWTIESSVEAAKGEVGLDDYEVRHGTGWYRHITLAMGADALRTVLRAGALAVEALKKRLPPPSRGAAWPRSKSGVAWPPAERPGDAPAPVAPGPGGAAHRPPHPGLVPLAPQASEPSQVRPL